MSLNKGKGLNSIIAANRPVPSKCRDCKLISSSSTITEDGIFMEVTTRIELCPNHRQTPDLSPANQQMLPLSGSPSDIDSYFNNLPSCSESSISNQVLSPPPAPEELPPAFVAVPVVIRYHWYLMVELTYEN